MKENDIEVLKQRLKDSFRREKLLQDRITELQRTTFARFNEEEYWIFQDDGEDYPESLVCPVVISADKLREFLDNREILEELKKCLENN